LPPAKTDIAHYTTRVLPALSQLASVVLWTDQDKWDKGVEQYAEVRHYRLNRMHWVDLNRADANIYQIGNNPLFHGAIWQVSRLRRSGPSPTRRCLVLRYASRPRSNGGASTAHPIM